MKYILILITLSFCIALSAQKKFEREYRIDCAEVPDSAKDFIEKGPFKKKVKWYREESDQGVSIEAKTKHQGHDFSIEFDTLGTLQDIEITRRLRSLPVDRQKTIHTALRERYVKYHVKKLQLHYDQSKDELLDMLNARLGYDILPYYEIELKAKKDQTTKLYEILLSYHGDVLREREIQLDFPTNMEF